MLNYSMTSSSEAVIYPIMLKDYNLIGNLSENREHSFKIVVANTVGIASSSYRKFSEFNCIRSYMGCS